VRGRDARAKVDAAISYVGRFEEAAGANRSLAQDWERKSESSCRAEQHDMADEALRRSKEHIALAEEFHAQWKRLQNEVERLKEELREATVESHERPWRETEVGEAT
jgi:phage shock protein A